MGAVRDLLDRMCAGGDDFDAARREAKALDDPALLEEFRAVLTRSKDAGERTYSYFMLGDLARNSGDGAVADFLMQRVGKEKTGPWKHKALGGLGFARGARQAAEAIALLGHKDTSLRHGAIRALAACGDAACEAALLGVLEAPVHDADVGQAAKVLARIGTTAAAPALAAIVRERPRDRQFAAAVAAAMLGLARVDAAEALGLALAELGAKGSEFTHWAAMNVVATHGGPGHVGAVGARLRAFVARANRPDLDYSLVGLDVAHPDEFEAGVAFLRRVGGPEAAACLAELAAGPLLEIEAAFLRDPAEAHRDRNRRRSLG